MKRLSDKDLIEAYMSAKKLLDIDPLFINQLETELKRRSISIENKQKKKIDKTMLLDVTIFFF